jgi:hypothetical protein
MTTARPIPSRRIALLGAAVALALLPGCASRLNPFNWFGPSEERVVLYPEGGFVTKVDRRSMIETITKLEVEQVAGGAVVHATGLPQIQGHWDAELVSTTDFAPENGVLLLEFRVRPPRERTASGTPRSREVEVGLFLSRQKLAEVREIRVQGLANSRSVRR